MPLDDTGARFHDGRTVAPPTPWCPAVSTTLPAIDQRYDELLLGPVGVEPPLDDDEAPPHAAVKRSVPAVARRKR